ncbi:hypothetical protein HDK90DRAFT_483768 [Phyllosticta capitalensis]|uniref:Uncharacterized protein n=1 Tax=Phyllosticta capitalensis TaxID=121624 RepID=A0ABR1YNM9_9PEZI
MQPRNRQKEKRHWIRWQMLLKERGTLCAITEMLYSWEKQKSMQRKQNQSPRCSLRHLPFGPVSSKYLTRRSTSGCWETPCFAARALKESTGIHEVPDFSSVSHSGSFNRSSLSLRAFSLSLFKGSSERRPLGMARPSRLRILKDLCMIPPFSIATSSASSMTLTLSWYSQRKTVLFDLCMYFWVLGWTGLICAGDSESRRGSREIRLLLSLVSAP